jgi:hypothetical protein
LPFNGVICLTLLFSATIFNFYRLTRLGLTHFSKVFVKNPKFFDQKRAEFRPFRGQNFLAVGSGFLRYS